MDWEKGYCYVKLSYFLCSGQNKNERKLDLDFSSYKTKSVIRNVESCRFIETC